MRPPAAIMLLLASSLSSSLYAQGQSFYSGVKVTGQLELKRTVNLSLQAQGRPAVVPLQTFSLESSSFQTFPFQTLSVLPGQE